MRSTFSAVTTLLELRNLLNLRDSTCRPYAKGQDSHGNWVAQDQNGVRGGIFVDCGHALRFVRSETGDRFPAFVSVSGVLELNMEHFSDRPIRKQFAIKYSNAE